jgi:hypothetical protein
VANFTAGTSFSDGVTNDVTAAKLNALVADAVPTSNLSLNSTTGTIATFNSTTPTFLGAITASTNTINVGSGQIYKDATGKVGVGTTSPVAKLDVYGDGYFQGIELGRGGQTGNRNALIDFTGDDTYTDYGFRVIRGDTGANASSSLIHRGTGSLFLQTTEAGPIILKTTSTERLRIESNGNVGIGTGWTAAADKLDVYGTAYFHGIELGKGGQTGNRNAIIDMIGDDTYTDYGFRIIRQNTGANAPTVLQVRGTGGLFLKTEEAGFIALQTTNTERMRIDSSGNVLVGTTTAVRLLTVAGSIYAKSSGGTEPLDLRNGDTTGTRNFIIFRVGASDSAVGAITTDGANTSYNTSSDYRLKINLEQITNGITRIKQLPVYRFNWISNPDGNKVDGFVAHEAKEIVPECVVGEKDAVDADGNPIYQGIDQSKIVPLLTAALKEAIAKIEVLEAKVTALEAA